MGKTNQKETLLQSGELSGLRKLQQSQNQTKKDLCVCVFNKGGATEISRMFGGEARQARANKSGGIGKGHAEVSRFSGDADKRGRVHLFLCWLGLGGKRNLMKFG